MPPPKVRHRHESPDEHGDAQSREPKQTTEDDESDKVDGSGKQVFLGSEGEQTPGGREIAQELVRLCAEDDDPHKAQRNAIVLARDKETGREDGRTDNGAGKQSEASGGGGQLAGFVYVALASQNGNVHRHAAGYTEPAELAHRVQGHGGLPDADHGGPDNPEVGVCT